jgi:hypothetical protein
MLGYGHARFRQIKHLVPFHPRDGLTGQGTPARATMRHVPLDAIRRGHLPQGGALVTGLTARRPSALLPQALDDGLGGAIGRRRFRAIAAIEADARFQFSHPRFQGAQSRFECQDEIHLGPFAHGLHFRAGMHLNQRNLILDRHDHNIW